jgi:hypothetical protein
MDRRASEFLEDSEILAILEADSDSDVAYDSDNDPEFIPDSFSGNYISVYS